MRDFGGGRSQGQVPGPDPDQDHRDPSDLLAPEEATALEGGADAPSAAVSRTCLNHPAAPAVCSCSQCAELFCPDCVDNPGPGAVCNECRQAEKSARPSDDPTIYEWTRGEGTTALTCALVGIFLCGPILQVVALVKASKVRREARRVGRGVAGQGRATAAMIISISWWIIFLLGMVARFNYRIN